MKIYKLSSMSYIPIISGLLFQLLFFNRAPEFPKASYLTNSLQNQKRDKTGTANIVFRSADGGQTCQDIREGLPGKLEEAGFSLSRKIRICQVFYRQAPGHQL
jgi:hypothetical protein